MPRLLPQTLPALLLGTALLAAPGVYAAPPAAAAEPQTAYALTFDAAGLLASPAGRLLMDRVKRAEPRMDGWIAGLTDSLGLDVTRDLGVVSLTSDDDQLSDMTLMADLGETSGKLEGWMLTLPGYDSEDLDDETLLHGFDIEVSGQAGEPVDMTGKRAVRVFAAVPRSRNGGYHLVASVQRELTIAMAGDVTATRNPLADASERLPNDRLLSLSLGRLPQKLLDDTADQPGAAAWRAVRALRLDIASGDRFQADVQVTASTAARGRQLKQLLGGLSAVMQLMASNEHAAAGEAASILSDLSLNDRADGTPGLEISLDIPQSRLETWVDRGVVPALR